MSKSDMIRDVALGMIGCAYIYGGTGQLCTPSYRQQQMRQYPTMANAIQKNCPVLSGKQVSCDGCKYQGKKAYDCAQVTRISAKAAGLTLPSGASSQWNKGDWAQKGTLNTLPRNRVCMLYQERGDSNPMGHTGVYLGDGMVVDARSHAAGVKYGTVESHKWTHWAILRGMEEADITMEQYRVNATKLALREGMSTKNDVLDRIDIGVTVTGCTTTDPEWVQVQHNGKQGYCMAKFLDRVKATEVGQSPTTELTDKQKLDEMWAWYQTQQA